MYNDYNFESTASIIDPQKHQRVYDYVKAALLRGVSIDTVGFQVRLSLLSAADSPLLLSSVATSGALNACLPS